MITNYLKIAWRNLVRHKAYSAINIAGLAIGVAACLLIFIVVRYELSYDDFQKNYSRIYRVVTETKHSDGSEEHNPGVPYPAVDALKADFPQFEKIAAINSSYGSQVTVLGDNPNSDVAASKKFIEDNNVIFAQPAYFDIFTTKWLSGDAKALNDPANIVLDRKTASKYFGDWKDATGKFLKLDNTLLLKVSGIIEEAPANSDFPVKAFISYEAFKQYGDKYGFSKEWGSLSSNHQVYVMLPQNLDPAGMQAQLKAFAKKHSNPNGRNDRSEILQPLKDMHFDYRYGTLGDHSSSKTILWTLALIGMLIILMASINFINLSTAQAVGRGKEVGIRKVMGSSRAQLIRQVMGETFLIVLCSMLLAIIIARLSIPYLSHVANTPKDISLFSPGSILFLLSVLIGVTLLSGTYPAMVVSGFKPALALKNKITSANIGGISLRRALVVTQFAISQILIIGTIVAVSQMNFVRNADLGFNKEAVLLLPSHSDSVNLSRMKPLKQQLLQNPGVISVSFANDEASSDNNWASNFAFDHKEDEDFPAFHKYGDEDYIKTFGLQLIAGRGYSASDTMHEIVVNETLLKKCGVTDPQKAIGKQLRIGGGSWLPVVGVVKDFKTNSLREEVKPLTITAQQTTYYALAVKLRTNNLSQTTAQIQKLWENTYPEYAYTSHFADDTIERFYRQETQLSLLYKIFAGIALFISCLGLYGLVSFMAVQKTKEVGIRKVLGASVGNIVIMFSKEFTILISMAFLIAVPVAWYFMNGWLQNFVYRISMDAWIFILAIVASLGIAWMTVGYRAVKAALANPVTALRSE
ncbi:MAG: FtsX-like permease family protein [Chitinophagaceae bacterium]|nr:FtsX-like permease family protein [Chitinophagaceae bacterium]